MSKYIIGVDIGTTSTKSILFDAANNAIARHTVGYPLHAPTKGAAVQNPDEIFQAVIETLKQVVSRNQIEPSELLCLSFSAAMHSLIAVDERGKPLTPSLTWADSRSAGYDELIKQEHNGHEIYARTGTPIHPMSPLVKLIWLRENCAELWQQAAKFISIKEYVVWQLFKKYVVDYSIASATGLFNFNNLAWDKEALSITGVTTSQLSQLVPTTHVLHSMKPKYAEQMGVAADLSVVIGANDGVLSNLGLNAIASGEVAITMGTSGAVRTTLKKPQTDPQERLFCYALTKDYWVVGGAVNNGGIVLRWLKETLARTEVNTAQLLQRDPYEIITEIAKTITPGSEGLIFHPYLTGERSPLWDANARGSFFGLGLHHHKAHLIRAVLEGVIYNLYAVFQAVETISGEVKSISAAGGFARSPLWCQILADVCDREINIPQSHESSALGAAILGQYALGEISELNNFSSIGSNSTYQPIAANTAKYRQILPIYSRLVDSFKDEYQAIAQLQRDL